MFTGLSSADIIECFGESSASNFKTPIKCASLINRPCQARPTSDNINSNETLFLSVYC